MNDKGTKMNMPIAGFAQFDQEISAFTVVLESLMRNVQRELNTKDTIQDVCKHMDMLSSLSTILLTDLRNTATTSDQVILFPVEFAIDIPAIKNHLSENFIHILEQLKTEKPTFIHFFSHRSLIKKTKTAQNSLNELFSYLESLKSHDNWDVTMCDDAENGHLDALLNEVNTDYSKGKINFQ